MEDVLMADQDDYDAMFMAGRGMGKEDMVRIMIDERLGLGGALVHAGRLFEGLGPLLPEEFEITREMRRIPSGPPPIKMARTKGDGGRRYAAGAYKGSKAAKKASRRKKGKR